MNNLIKELAEQATQEFSPVFEIDKWQEKFAELIVWECAKIAIDSATNDGISVANARSVTIFFDD